MRTRVRPKTQRAGKSKKSKRPKRTEPKGEFSPRVAAFQSRARVQLRKYRQGSLLAVALTSFLILLWDYTFALSGDPDPQASVEEATGTLRQLLLSFYAFLPKLIIALSILLLGWAFGRGIKRGFQWASWKGKKAATLWAVSQIGLFIGTIVIALSVLVGDIRALLGSLGLFGLALSWALQVPIESFTGWILNTLRSHYRVGDRIEVGDVFGDVYKIDFLTTTVWEVGGPGRPVSGSQPTGALITFPNSELLRSNIINYSKEFPFVWDEVTFGVDNESDLYYAMDIFQKVAEEVLGEEMELSVNQYLPLVSRAGFDYDVFHSPQIYLSLAESWINFTVRYLVRVRTRRKWSTALIKRMGQELSFSKHQGKIKASYPRYLVDLTRHSGDRPMP